MTQQKASNYAANDEKTQPFAVPQAQSRVEQFQPVCIPQPPAPPAGRKNRLGCCQGGCLILLIPLFLLALYFFAPMRTTMLVLGIDRTPDGTAVGRSDTIILVNINPLTATLNMLSIPRDLWVNVPNVGEQRINTAHFFAEAAETGSGPRAAAETVEENFGVRVPYTVRLRFDSFARVIDALGGVTIILPEDMAGLTAGEHHLNSEEALAFARNRSGSDDFFRMAQGQMLVRAVLVDALKPENWNRLPSVFAVASEAIDTNLPMVLYPRLGLGVLRAVVFDTIDNRTISREMVTPFTTSGGANVLLPNWDAINPVVTEMFGR